MTEQPDRAPRLPAHLLAALAAASAVVLWAYWTSLADVLWRWNHDPQYSHGYLVPGFAAYLLWMRRQHLAGADLRPSVWGLAVVLGAVAVRLAGARFPYAYLDHVSLLPCLAGLLLLVGGRAALAWAWPAVGFLAFMIPLPHTWSMALAGPMQAFATTVSTFLLQVVGRPALAEGNKILLNEIELGIVEACSGLRMLVVFFALSTAVAMLIKKPLWEKTIIALSAVPIALASNILRITITGLFYDAFGNNFGGHFFHDLAGWLMMPLGLAFLGLELWVLRTLLIDPPAGKPLPSVVTMQRVEVGPAGLYARGSAPRREKWTAPAKAPAADEAPAAEEAPAAQP